LLPGEIHREHGQADVDAPISGLGFEQAFDVEPGTDFSGVGR
jgi:hypothetical protein